MPEKASEAYPINLHFGQSLTARCNRLGIENIALVKVVRFVLVLFVDLIYMPLSTKYFDLTCSLSIHLVQPMSKIRHSVNSFSINNFHLSIR